MPRLRKVIECNGVAEVTVGAVTTLIDADDLALIEGHYLSFTRTKTTSYVTAMNARTRKTTRLARLLMKPPAGLVVDHIDGNPLNNRRANLRVVSLSENGQNRAKRGDRVSSKFKGVCRVHGRWLAVIYRDYRQFKLGWFDAEVDAARAYDTAAREMFGQCAALNFPKAGEQSAHRPRTITFHSATDTPGGQ